MKIITKDELKKLNLEPIYSRKSKSNFSFLVRKLEKGQVLYITVAEWKKFGYKNGPSANLPDSKGRFMRRQFKQGWTVERV